MKNLMGKSRKIGERPYMVFEIPLQDGGVWRIEVLKSWQADGSKQYARAFCRVITPMTGSSGDLGDTYVEDIYGEVVDFDPDVFSSAAEAAGALYGRQ